MAQRGGDAASGEEFLRGLVERGAKIRLPELFTHPPDPLFHLPDRHGVSLVVLRTTDLSEAQRVELLRHRLVQYVLANQINVERVARDRLAHEPVAHLADDDIHLIAGIAETGEILSYAALRARGDPVGEKTMADPDRPLFPVEEVFGWGVFNRLRILPELPMARIRELVLLPKNQLHYALDERLFRAPIELLLAMLRLLDGPLRTEIVAVVGDADEHAARRNFELFHVPSVIVHGVVPYAADSAGLLDYQHRVRVPWAFLVTDVPNERLAAVAQALALPGREGITALLALERDVSPAKSTFEPPGGLGALSTVSLPDQGGAMPVRRELRELGDWLRGTRLFRTLTVAEAAVLGTFMERRAAAAGDAIIRQAETGDDLYLIESGEAEVQVVDAAGRRTVVAELGHGDCFGEIALVTGGERTADVVARTPMSLMRLGGDDYARYLAHLVDVDRQLTHTALARARHRLESVRRDGEGRARFRCEGEVWAIAWAGKEVRLRDMRGLHYLATLLREPNREFHASDLVGGKASAQGSVAPEADSLRIGFGTGDAGERIDAKARAAYRARLGNLEEELAEAERCNDRGRLERANEEKEALIAELVGAARGRRASSDAERARVSATKGIKAALEKIAAAHPELGAHLQATVRRGYFCSYAPDPRHPVDWEA